MASLGAEVAPVLERLREYLANAEQEALRSERRRGIRALAVYSVALGAAVAIADLTPDALKVIHTGWAASGDVLLRIITVTLAVAAGMLLAAEYFEPMVELVLEIACPPLLSAALIGVSLAGPDLVPVPLLGSMIVTAVTALYLAFLEDHDRHRELTTGFWRALTNVAGRPRRPSQRLRAAMTLNDWVTDRMGRIIGAGAGVALYASWIAYLATHSLESRSSLVLWLVIASIAPLLVAAIALASLINPGFRADLRGRAADHVS